MAFSGGSPTPNGANVTDGAGDRRIGGEVGKDLAQAVLLGELRRSIGAALGERNCTPACTICMNWRYREDRATQAAARFLKKRGGTMSYMKLLKLLYLADRLALLELGRPITFDRFYSMKHGPVLSRTLELMTEDPDPLAPSYWAEIISPPSNYEVRLKGEAPHDQLSPAQEDIIDRVYAQYGHMHRFQIRDFTHTLPEWSDPNGSSIPIRPKDVLLAQGVSADDADEIVSALEDESMLAALIG